nr:1867_t:CDS:2 [Entrophospora candida]
MYQNYSDNINNNNIDSNNNIGINMNDVNVNNQEFVPNNYNNQTADHYSNNYYIYQNPEENNLGHQNSQNFVENNYIVQNSGDGFTGVVGGYVSDNTSQNPPITTSINYLNNCFDNSFIGQNVHQNNDQLPLLIYIVFQLQNIQNFLFNNNNNRY